MKKIFFTIWILVFIYCCFVLFGGSYKKVGRNLLYDEASEGYHMAGMYNITRVDAFKQFVKLYPYKETDSIEETDIIAYGDSFFNSSYNDYFFAQKVEDTTDLKVFNVKKNDLTPVEYLKSIGYKKGKNKFLIYERVERSSLEPALVYDHVMRARESFASRIQHALIWRLDAFNTWVKSHFVQLHNYNQDYTYFFRKNRLIYPVTKWLANTKFKYFRELDKKKIGKYTINPNMLFIADAVVFNEKEKSEKDIQKLSDFVVNLSRDLKEQYNITLIYSIIPNKITVYGDKVSENYKYDNYIPEVNKRLIQQGVIVVDIYSKFMKYRQDNDSEFLYFTSDSHWTPLGKGMFVELVRKIIEPESYYTAVALTYENNTVKSGEYNE